jgi:hypothetical protein
MAPAQLRDTLFVGIPPTKVFNLPSRDSPGNPHTPVCIRVIQVIPPSCLLSLDAVVQTSPGRIEKKPRGKQAIPIRKEKKHVRQCDGIYYL